MHISQLPYYVAPTADKAGKCLSTSRTVWPLDRLQRLGRCTGVSRILQWGFQRWIGTVKPERPRARRVMGGATSHSRHMGSV